jgi:hypothetical protein
MGDVKPTDLRRAQWRVVTRTRHEMIPMMSRLMIAFLAGSGRTQEPVWLASRRAAGPGPETCQEQRGVDRAFRDDMRSCINGNLVAGSVSCAVAPAAPSAEA